MGSREPAPQTLILSSSADVERLRSSPWRLWRLHSPLSLQIPGLGSKEREQHESRLNSLANTCGCAAGSFAGALAIIAIALYWIQRDVSLSWRSVGISLAIVIAVALLAKLLHVLSARVRLYQALGDAQRRDSGVIR